MKTPKNVPFEIQAKKKSISPLLATISDGYFYKNPQTLTEIRRECTIFLAAYEPAIRKFSWELAKVYRFWQELVWIYG